MYRLAYTAAVAIACGVCVVEPDSLFAQVKPPIPATPPPRPPAAPAIPAPVTVAPANQSKPDTPAAPEIWAYKSFVKIVNYPRTGASIGRGWNSFLEQETAADCVDFKVDTENRWNSTIQYTLLHDREQLFNTLNVSMSAKYGASIFSASGEADLAKSSAFSTENLNILASALVQSQILYASPQAPNTALELKPTYKKLLEDNPAEFQRVCGDHFIVAAAFGGKLNILSSMHVDSAEEKSSLTAKFSAHLFSGSGNATFSQTFDSKRDHDQTRIDFHQEGGPEVPLPLDATSAEMQTALQTFVKRQNFDSHGYELYLLPYWQIGAVGDELASNLYAADYIASHYWRLSDLARTYRDELEHKNDYLLTLMEDEPDVIAAEAYLHKLANDFDALVGQCIQNHVCNSAEAIVALDGSTLQSRSLPTKPGGQMSDDQKVGLINRTIGLPAFVQAATRIADPSSQETVFKLISHDVSDISVGLAGKSLAEILAGSSPKITSAFKDQAASPVGKQVSTQLKDLNDARTKAVQDAIAIDKPAAETLQSSGFTYYLQRYALMPLSKADVHNIFYDTNGHPLLTGDDTPEQHTKATQLLQDWIFRRRLLPLVQDFCALSEGHPLCYDSNVLLNLALLAKAKNIDLAQFKPVPPPPSPPPPPPAPPKPVIFPDMYPCGRSGQRC